MMDTKAKFYEEIESLFDLCLLHETGESWALALKVGEELGEFQEVVLKGHGYLQHKTPKEDDWSEAADIVNTLIGYFAQRYPHMSARELTEKFYNAICRKGDKYRTILLPEES